MPYEYYEPAESECHAACNSSCHCSITCKHFVQSVANQMTPKDMEVCPICGAFLVVGDAPQRVEEHAAGKQHVGYAKVRDMIDTLKVATSIYFTTLLQYYTMYSWAVLCLHLLYRLR